MNIPQLQEIFLVAYSRYRLGELRLSMRCQFLVNKEQLACFVARVSQGRLGCASSALARGIHQPSHPDTDSVKRDHRGSEKTHVQDVGGRSDHCGDNENREDGIPRIPPHPARCNHPHQSEKKHENWHFENQAETNDDCQKQLRDSPIVIMG